MSASATKQSTSPNQTEAPAIRLTQWLAPFHPRRWTLSAIGFFIAAQCLTLLALALGDGAMVRRVFAYKPTQSKIYTDGLRDGVATLERQGGRLTGSYELTNGQIALAPGGEAILTLPFDGTGAERALLALGAPLPPDCANSLRFIYPDGRAHELTNIAAEASRPYDLSPLLQTSPRLTLEWRASRPAADTGPPKTVFTGLRLELSLGGHLEPLPRLGFAWALFGVLLLWAGRAPVLERRRWLAASALLIILLILQQTPLNSPGILMALAAAAALAWLVDELRRGRPIAPAFFPAALALILALALGSLWVGLAVMKEQPIAPDSVTFMQYATEFKGLWNTGSREPFIIWAMKAFFAVAGASEMNLRLLCIAMLLAGGVAAYILGRKIAGDWGGLLAAVIILAGPGLQFHTLRTSRNVVLLPFLTLAAWLILKYAREGINWRRAAALAAMLGLCILNLFSSFIFLLLAALLIGGAARWKWRNFIPIAVVPLVVIFPHLLNNKREFGDFLHSSNIHAKFYRNMEFQGRPGFPTREDVAKDSYTGPSTSIMKYILFEHSPVEVVARSARGFWRIYAADDVRLRMLGHDILYMLFFVGCAAAALRRRWDILALLLLFNLTSYFLAGTREFAFDWRLTMHAAPLAAALAALGLIALAEAAAPWMHSSPSQTDPPPTKSDGTPR